ncbi:hypothetical protein [uncultured Methylophaga sp.]|uniref:hypothetical protein n=1 Tax=uncultured Methylophaga sp. TaxID=285271 RepID=UPI0030FB072E
MQDSNNFDAGCCEDGANPRSPRPQQEHCQGTQSSNTVPSNCINTSQTKILRVGIDSLYLSYQGELFEDKSIRLNQLKKLAQSNKETDIPLAQENIKGHLFEVKDRGRHPFAFILNDNHYRIEIAKLGAKRTPLTHAQISSELLTCQGAPLAVEVLTDIVSTLGIVTSSANVSRADLCVDFITDYPLSSITETQWVTRARDIDRFTVSRVFSGFVIGGGGNILARLYNKSLEMIKTPRPYLQQIYNELGVLPEQQVWRLEFQFRRESLRQLGITSFHDLNSALGSLWRYGTEQWLRLCIPNETDKTQSRWETVEFWQILQQVYWSGDSKIQKRATPLGRAPCDRTLFVNGLSALSSFMAREGITDPVEGSHAFIRTAKQYHDSREYLTGLDFFGYLHQKVSEKARKFNSFKNMPADSHLHPADAAIADAYRKLSDGE